MKTLCWFGCLELIVCGVVGIGCIFSNVIGFMGLGFFTSLDESKDIRSFVLDYFIKYLY